MSCRKVEEKCSPLAISLCSFSFSKPGEDDIEEEMTSARVHTLAATPAHVEGVSEESKKPDNDTNVVAEENKVGRRFYCCWLFPFSLLCSPSKRHSNFSQSWR